jgi:hypothetical protein
MAPVVGATSPPKLDGVARYNTYVRDGETVFDMPLWQIMSLSIQAGLKNLRPGHTHSNSTESVY